VQARSDDDENPWRKKTTPKTTKKKMKMRKQWIASMGTAGASMYAVLSDLR